MGSQLTLFFLRTRSLKKFEVIGGLVSGTEESRGKISLDRPNRQWDYQYVVLLKFLDAHLMALRQIRMACLRLLSTSARLIFY